MDAKQEMSMTSLRFVFLALVAFLTKCACLSLALERVRLEMPAAAFGNNGAVVVNASSSHSNDEVNGVGVLWLRGSSSSTHPKKAYRLEFQDENGDDLKRAFLGMPGESDWILYPAYRDKTLVRDVLAYDLWREMGYYAPRWRFVELFLVTNQTSLESNVLSAKLVERNSESRRRPGKTEKQSGPYFNPLREREGALNIADLGRGNPGGQTLTNREYQLVPETVQTVGLTKGSEPNKKPHQISRSASRITSQRPPPPLKAARNASTPEVSLLALVPEIVPPRRAQCGKKGSKRGRSQVLTQLANLLRSFHGPKAPRPV